MGKVETIKSALKFLVQKQIKQGSHGFSDNNDNEVSWKEVLEWIEQPTVEMAEDCVSREEAIRIAEEGQIQGYEWQFKKLCNLPPVSPQPKTGQWIAEINDYGEVMGWHCDKCYEDSGFTTTCKWDFCPSCGTKMLEVNADDIDSAATIIEAEGCDNE